MPTPKALNSRIRTPLNGPPDQVSLNLHQHVVLGRAAVDRKHRERRSQIVLHRGKHIAYLMSDCFERRPVRYLRATSPTTSPSGQPGRAASNKERRARQERVRNKI